MKDDMNCGRIFHDMTDEGWEALVGARKREISDYIYQAMFDDNENPEAEMIEFFRSTNFEPFDVQKGTVLSHSEYSTDTDSILEEVKAWSELAADKYLKGLSEDDRKLLSREYVGKIISRYVLEQVAEVVQAAHDGPKPIANILFRMLPKTLDAHTKPATGGLFGLISGIIGDNADRENHQEREYKPWLYHNPWETLEKVRRDCIDAMERIREYEGTESTALKAYLVRPDTSMESYGNLKSRQNAMQMIAKLDGKIREMGIFHTNDREKDILLGESKLVAYLADSACKLHKRVFDYQVAEMEKLIDSAEPADVSPLQLLKRLEEYRNSAPDNFYPEEIMSGRSAVEKFGNPDFVKDWVRASFGEVVTERWDRKKHAKELAYIVVLGEMKGCQGYNDLCFEPLAKMLVAQENGAGEGYCGLAFVFSGYVAWHEGSPDCIQGMEKEGIDVKTEFVSMLDYNAKHDIADQRTYERKLKACVMAAGTHDEKMEVLEKAGEELRQAKADHEKMMNGAL